MEKAKKTIKKALVACLAVLLLIAILPPQSVDAATTKISKCTVSLSKTSYNYTGSACKPTVTVKYNGKKLKKDTDYTVSYKNNKYPGTATVTIKGKGKYSGSVSKTFKIKNALTVTLSKDSYAYTGKAIKPTMTVKSGSKKLSSSNYNVTYANNKAVGTASMEIKGKGKYAGKNAYVTFKITKKSIADTTITLSKTGYTYTGSACKPTVTVKNGSVTMVSGTDYTVSYSNNTNVGTATVTIKGKGNYSNTTTKTFAISAKAITSADVTLSETNYTYNGQAKKPTVTVKSGTKTLTSGTDYTFSYKNNVNVGTATVTVTGKGNYTGTATKNFSINHPPISITPTSKTINSGERFNITIVNRPAQFTLGTYTSTNTNVATVGWDGSVFEVIGNNPGTTQIRIVINGTQYTCDVTVSQSASNNPNPGNQDPSTPRDPLIEDRGYRVGDYAYAQPVGELIGMTGTITWTSSDETVAKIYDTKEANKKFVNFIGAGTVTISAVNGSVTKQIQVTVAAAQDDLSCKSTSATYESITTSGEGLSYGQSASSVVGQTGLEETTATELNNPNGFAYSKIGDTYYCFVADVYNNRVLCYTGTESVVDALSGGNLTADNSTEDEDYMSAPGTPAYILGQPNATSTTPGYGANQMNWPMSVAVETRNDGTCRLYVADTENNRILIYEDITSLSTGASADYILSAFAKEDGSRRDLDWPWSVASINVDGVQKLLITSTVGTELGIYTSPLDGAWTDEITVDLIYSFGSNTTPRAITWTGTQLLIGDENIRVNGSARSGFHVFNEFPTSQESECFAYCGETGYSEGAIVGDKLYLVFAGGWNIFYKNEDGTYIESANVEPDLQLLSCREDNYRTDSNSSGYFLDAGGTQKVTYIEEDDTLVMVMLGRSAIYAWTNPSSKLSSLSTSAPDIYIGDTDYKEDLRHVASDVQMHNPNVVSDGTHLVVHNDLEGMLYVYKKIPTSDGAIADYKYTLFNAATDVELYTKNGTSTMILTGNSNNTLYIWDNYKFDGALPNRALRNRIGGMNLPELGAILLFMRYDGEYSYLTIAEQGALSLYVFEGLVGEDTPYIAKITGLGSGIYGHPTSNSDYLAISVQGFDENFDGRGGVFLMSKEILEDATAEDPLLLDVNAQGVDGVCQITRVQCGVTATAENDLEDNGIESELCHYTSEVNACKNNGRLIKQWTDKFEVAHTSHEYSTFSLIGNCLLTGDGKLIVADTGHQRVVVWSSVTAAIADQSKDYANLTVDSNDVVILGHGAKVYDSEDMNGHTVYEGHNTIRATYSDTMRMPRFLAYDGSNLWVGEFKFSNRLLRFELK